MNRKEVYEQLKEISELEKNWDEYDANPISAATIKNTQNVIDILPDTWLEPILEPTTADTICVEYDILGKSLILEIHSNKCHIFIADGEVKDYINLNENLQFDEDKKYIFEIQQIVNDFFKDIQTPEAYDRYIEEVARKGIEQAIRERDERVKNKNE